MTQCKHPDGCGQPVAIKGWCRPHYKRLWKAGSVGSVQTSRQIIDQNAPKACAECGNVKDADEFDLHSRGRRRANCRSCSSRYHRERYAEDPEPAKARALARVSANPEGKRAADADYYLRNRDQVLARVRAYSLDNPEVQRAHAARRKVRITVDMTAEDRRDSIEWRKAIKDDPCFYCGEHAEVMHDDHMTPLAKGGTDHWWNLVRACASCNLRKSATTAEEFMERLAREEGVINA